MRNHAQNPRSMNRKHNNVLIQRQGLSPRMGWGACCSSGRVMCTSSVCSACKKGRNHIGTIIRARSTLLQRGVTAGGCRLTWVVYAQQNLWTTRNKEVCRRRRQLPDARSSHCAKTKKKGGLRTKKTVNNERDRVNKNARGCGMAGGSSYLGEHGIV